MKEHRQLISNSLAECPPLGRSFFALLCADRLRNCCWSYQQTGKSDISPYFSLIDDLFGQFENAGQFDHLKFGEAVLNLESDMPTEGDPLSVQAQSGVMCLMLAVQMLDNYSSQCANDIVNAMADACDNYLYHLQVRLSDDHSSPESSVLLQRETEKQRSDLDLARNASKYSKNDLIRFRILNYQYSIPSAV